MVQWVNNILGSLASCSQVGLKAYLSRKPSRKVRAVEVPFGWSKHKSSSSALKSAIHVKSLLSDLSKLLQGNFYLLSATLRDLKGGRGSGPTIQLCLQRRVSGITTGQEFGTIW